MEAILCMTEKLNSWMTVNILFARTVFEAEDSHFQTAGLEKEEEAFSICSNSRFFFFFLKDHSTALV